LEKFLFWKKKLFLGGGTFGLTSSLLATHKLATLGSHARVVGDSTPSKCQI